MTAQEIKQLPDEQLSWFHRLVPPFLETRMEWRHFPLLKERQVMPPPTHSVLPELAETLPAIMPQRINQLHGFINPDMTG